MQKKPVFLIKALIILFFLVSETTVEQEVADVTSGLYDYNSDSLFFNDEPEAISSDVFYGVPHFLHTEGALAVHIRHDTQSQTWMIIPLIAGLFLISTALFHFSQGVSLSLRGVLGLRFFYLIDKEESLFRETYTYLLFVNFLIVMSLLVYQGLQQLNWLHSWQGEHQAVIYILIFAGLTVFYPIKLMLISFLAWIFNTRKASFVYLENIFVFNFFIGLVFLPLVFYNAFSPSHGVLYTMWGIIALANVYKFIRGAYLAYHVSGFSVCYLFLYLCAVELAPLLVIGKVLKIYLSAP